MQLSVPLVDFSPSWRLLATASLAAAGLLAVLAWRSRRLDAAGRLAALTALTAFLTFDLIVFGSFTRLTDSGLGCPDWPGCYGQASPLGAGREIEAAEATRPDGPVTLTKAWIEMIHRYLAMTVGVLILVVAVAGTRVRDRLPHSSLWAWLTLLWVVVQGLFGKYTVTLKLYPAIVTLHLLGGLVLLALLVRQLEGWRGRALRLAPPTGEWAACATLALWLQIALGGWVSTNYAVLACRGFPTCNGQWWPVADLAQGFAVFRELGHTGDGALLGFDALVGIHVVHRLFAIVALAALGVLAWRLWRHGGSARRPAWVITAIASTQALSGLSNVVLDWPMAAALVHSAGAAGLVAVTTSVLVRARLARRGEPEPGVRLAANTTAS